MKNFLKKNILDGVIISKKENIKYLSNFSGTFGFLIYLKNEKQFLITDKRYLSGAKKEFKNFEVVEINSENFFDIFKNLKNIGFEGDDFTVEKLKKFEKLFPGKKFKYFTKILDEKRLIKNEDEIAKMKKAGKIAQKSLEETLKEIKIGISEKKVAEIFQNFAKKNGAEKLSFETIVAFGENSALPHHKVSDRKLKKGDNILIDFGVIYKDYCSDCTRNFFTEKDERKEKIYNLVKKAQEKGCKMAKEGEKISTICKEVDKIFKKEKVLEKFIHCLGHGVGQEVHEAPSVHNGEKSFLKKGMFITIEPGLYFEGDFGVRIEDTILITKNGNENLYDFSKEFQILNI